MFATPQLPFEFSVVACIRVAANETYTLVVRAKDKTYVSYVMDDDGNCFTGHYDMSKADGLRDVMDRATRSPRYQHMH